MGDMIFSMLGLRRPEGVPTVLATAAAVNGYTEEESRQAMVEGGNQLEADQWIQSMKQAGFFEPSPGSGIESQRLDPSSGSFGLTAGAHGNNDNAGSFLWQGILKRLRRGENSFKHQVMV